MRPECWTGAHLNNMTSDFNIDYIFATKKLNHDNLPAQPAAAPRATAVQAPA